MLINVRSSHGYALLVDARLSVENRMKLIKIRSELGSFYDENSGVRLTERIIRPHFLAIALELILRWFSSRSARWHCDPGLRRPQPRGKRKHSLA